MEHANTFLQDLAIIMLVAGVITVIFHRLRQPVVLGSIAIIAPEIATLFVASILPALVPEVATLLPVVTGTLAVLATWFARRSVVLATLAGALAHGATVWLMA